MKACTAIKIAELIQFIQHCSQRFYSKTIRLIMKVFYHL